MASMKKCIEDKCKDCIYDSAIPGTWREQVENCRSEKTCALWPVRPMTVATVNLNRKGRVESDAGTSIFVDGVNIDSLLDSIEDDDEVRA